MKRRRVDTGMMRTMRFFDRLRRISSVLRSHAHLPLSQDEILHYRTEGLIIPKFRVPEPALLRFEQELSAILPVDAGDTPDFVSHIHALPGLASAVVRFAQTPEILDVVGQLIGCDIALWGAGLFGKPPLRGKATPWHQDAAVLEYQAIRPVELCTVWVALDESTPENGCVRYIPGSHRERAIRTHVQRPTPGFTLHHMVEDRYWPESCERNAILQRGQASIHDVYLVHGSTANRSGKRRAGIALRYMPTTSYYDREFARQFDAPDRPMYLVRGIDRCGTNNLLAPPMRH
jgi:Phytanoyl-CoA dioxygenase (PhyH)